MFRSFLQLAVLQLRILNLPLRQGGKQRSRPLQRVARPCPGPETLALRVADTAKTLVLHATEYLVVPKAALRHHHLIDITGVSPRYLTEAESANLADPHELHRQLTHKSLPSRYRRLSSCALSRKPRTRQQQTTHRRTSNQTTTPPSPSRQQSDT